MLGTDSILPLVQYFAYIEITAGEPQNLWREYEKLQAPTGQLRHAAHRQPADIYPVFRELFKKKLA
jgi:uncharacterized sporulation protein YeaH/YhbH (DUF444 family)